MPVNTHIFLPLHVRAARVADVVAKVVGAEAVQRTHSDSQMRRVDGRWKSIPKPRPFDPAQPSGPENPWYVSFEERGGGPGFQVAPHDGFSHGQLVFQDMLGQHHAWFFFPEHEDERYKLLSPGCHGLAVAVAVGRRLVSFFGGHLVPTDTNDRVTLRVPNTRARFPVRRVDQTSNDRWYQFANALNTEPVLSASELRAAMEAYGGNSTHDALLAALEPLEREKNLEAVLPEASAGQPGFRRRM